MVQRKWWLDCFYVALGSIIFSASVNLFVVPMGVYNGGIIGIAQIIRTFLVDALHLNFSFDIAGILNFLFNIPLFLIAYKSISKKFLLYTLFAVIVQTITFSLVPIPANPILEDPLTAMILAGLMGGIGSGISLRAGGSGAGVDILGVFLSMRSKTFTVGKLSIIINAMIYLYCAVVFSFSNAVYSIIYAVIFGLATDKFHTQNIVVQVLVFTKNFEVKQHVLSELHRGVTCWQGFGAYTNEKTDVFVTIVSKYELPHLKQCILAFDPQAFLIISEGNQIIGNYEKRL